MRNAIVNAAHRTNVEGGRTSGQVLIWGPRDECVRVIEVDASTAKVEFIEEVATVVLSDYREAAKFSLIAEETQRR